MSGLAWRYSAKNSRWWKRSHWRGQRKSSAPKTPMHYKNGREAKPGDIVVCLDNWNRKVGIVYDLKPGATTCNARLAPVSNTDANITLSDCMHIEDCEPRAGVAIPVQ